MLFASSSGCQSSNINQNDLLHRLSGNLNIVHDVQHFIPTATTTTEKKNKKKQLAIRQDENVKGITKDR